MFGGGVPCCTTAVPDQGIAVGSRSAGGSGRPGQSFRDQCFHAAPREDGVTLTLDVARTPDPAASYEAMASVGLSTLP